MRMERKLKVKADVGAECAKKNSIFSLDSLNLFTVGIIFGILSTWCQNVNDFRSGDHKAVSARTSPSPFLRTRRLLLEGNLGARIDSI